MKMRYDADIIYQNKGNRCDMDSDTSLLIYASKKLGMAYKQSVSVCPALGDMVEGGIKS